MQSQAITSIGLALRRLIRECKFLYYIVKYCIIYIQIVNFSLMTVTLVSCTTLLKGLEINLEISHRDHTLLTILNVLNLMSKTLYTVLQG